MNSSQTHFTKRHTWLRLAWVGALACGLLFSPAPIVPPVAADSAGATVDAGTLPYTVAVNPVTNKVYVANNKSSNVTVIDGADNSTTTVAAGTKPYAVAVNPVTNKIYVTNEGSNNVTVIDGRDNSTATVGAGTSPFAVAVNPVTNKIYVANWGSANVTVIDGIDNSTTIIGAGTKPRAVAVNPLTKKIYVANEGSSNVTVIDGMDHSTTTVATGAQPRAVGVNPMANKVYVANLGSANVTAITPARAVASPLTTNITPLPADATCEERPSFSFSASSTFSPVTPPVRQIYYQVDTNTGPWLKASPSGATGSGQIPALLPGTHLLFALAVDGQEATSINTGQGSSPVIGQISSYHFLMNGPCRFFVPLILKGY